MEFRIYSRTNGSEWTTESVGEDSANWFATEDEALAMIDQLKTIGEDWATAEYEVREETRS